MQDRADYEARLVAAVNVERRRHGLSQLSGDGCAERHADAQAGEMPSSGGLAHQDLNAVLAACGASRAAENVGRGAVPPEQMVRRWMDSPGHRANILDPALTRLGTGAVRAGDGTWWTCQVFLAR